MTGPCIKQRRGKEKGKEIKGKKKERFR